MGQHKNGNGMGDAYKRTQRLRAVPRLLADSRAISQQGLMLRWTPKGTMFVRAPRQANSVLVKRLHDAVARRLQVGLGKADRIEAKAQLAAA